MELGQLMTGGVAPAIMAIIERGVHRRPALAHALRPDIVLMDISMPGMDGIEATEKLTEMNTGARVVMLTSYSEREKITEALAAGAVSYLTKDSPPDAVVRAIRSAAASTET